MRNFLVESLYVMIASRSVPKPSSMASTWMISAPALSIRRASWTSSTIFARTFTESTTPVSLMARIHSESLGRSWRRASPRPASSISGCLQWAFNSRIAPSSLTSFAASIRGSSVVLRTLTATTLPDVTARISFFINSIGSSEMNSFLPRAASSEATFMEPSSRLKAPSITSPASPACWLANALSAIPAIGASAMGFLKLT